MILKIKAAWWALKVYIKIFPYHFKAHYNNYLMSKQTMKVVRPTRTGGEA